ncbi:MAG TPA: transketolase, partial [Candidatus Limnocylindrales bacterium]
QHVDDGEDLAALDAAFAAAKAETQRPSMIVLRTIIGWPAPNKQNTGKIHGSALGKEEVAATKRILGFSPDASFEVDAEVLEHAREVKQRGREAHVQWRSGFQKWADEFPERAELLDRMQSRTLPNGWAKALPSWPADPKGIATRAASGQVLNALAPVLPELWGGSADLAESNNTTMKGEPSFVPAEYSTKEFQGDEYGRVLHFGVREHGMGSILNGIVLHGGTRPYGGTFLIFSDYMRPAVRLAALMKLPVIYVWTHDSIGLGEDGPTHQPVEQLAALRAIPGLDVVRPADANETAHAWRMALTHTDRPTALCLTRQNLPVMEPSSIKDFEKGGYILAEASEGSPEVIIIATGSEVNVAVTARERLEAEGHRVRVVSMPCREWFDRQEEQYRHKVLPPSVKARVSVEAGVAMPWRDLVGPYGQCVSLEHFGASAPYQVLFEQFGFTPDNVVAAARATLSRTAQIKGETTGN